MNLLVLAEFSWSSDLEKIFINIFLFLFLNFFTGVTAHFIPP